MSLSYQALAQDPGMVPPPAPVGPTASPSAPPAPPHVYATEGGIAPGLVAGLAVVGLLGLFAGAAVLQAWSYDWDWKCLVANCERFIQGGKRRR